MPNKNSANGLVKGFILICIGCVLIGVGLSLGGRLNNTSWWPFDSGGFNFNWNDDSDDEHIIRDVEILEGAIPSTVNRFDIKMKAASLVIRVGPVAGYRATDFEKNSLRVSVSGNTFTVEESEWQHSISFGNNHLKPHLEITLPAGKLIEDCSLSVGAGSVSLDGLQSENLEIGSGAGSITGTDLIAKKALVKTGAGSLEFSSCTFNDTEIETGAGRIRFEGDMTSRSTISTGAGSVSLSLAGRENDYRIDFTRGIGSVKIGSASYNGVGNGSGGNRDAKKQITLSTAVGSVDIRFNE